MSRPSSKRPAACAFRHFLQRGLGVSALDEREKDADTWLGPEPGAGGCTRSTRRCCGAIARPARPAHDGFGGGSAVAARTGKGPARRASRRDAAPVGGSLRPRVPRGSRRTSSSSCSKNAIASRRARRSVSRSRLATRCTRTMMANRKRWPRREAPVVVDLGQGRTFKLAGRIDRIDQVGEATFEIIDYKTGEATYAKTWAAGSSAAAPVSSTRYAGVAAVQLLKRHKCAGAGSSRHLLLLECQGWQGAPVDRHTEQGGARGCSHRSPGGHCLGDVHSRRG